MKEISLGNFGLLIAYVVPGFTFISTARTPNEWKEKGGAKAFLSEITKLIMRHDVREQLKRELG